MSKITQENPAVDNSVVKPVSNTSKSTTHAKSTGTAAKAANTW